MFSHEQQIFMKTIYDFCKYEYDFSYSTRITPISLNGFIAVIQREAFRDRDYRNGLYQQFKTKETIIFILNYICSLVWNNLELKNILISF